MRRRRAQATNMRRTIGLFVLAILTSRAPAAAQRFFPDDPLEREPTPLPAIDPGPRNLSFLLEAVSAALNRPGDRHPRPDVIASQGVNTLDDVLDGAWYVNRHGHARLSLDELQRGSGGASAPSTSAPWRVLLMRSQNARATIVFRDSNNQMYLLRFDPADSPEMATGAEMIASRFFHALGYHVPETYLVAFTRDRLVVESNASDVTSIGDMRRLLPEDIDRLLAPVARRRDGSYRAVALRVPTEAGALIGPFQFFGTRSDDPNDIVSHEHRRDLRGLYVFSSWVNHTRIDSLHTMDIVVTPENQPPHVRHYLFDFMATLGSGVTRAKPVWEGRDPVYGQQHTIRNVAGLGLYTPAWMRAKYPNLPAVGRFESATFDADAWTPNYDIAPFATRLPDDTFWAARQVMAFTDDDIRAIVRVAQYSDQNAGRWIADSLIERRNRIGRTYFARVLPLDDFEVRGGELVFTDLAVRYGFAEPRRYRVEWRLFDDAAGEPGNLIRSEDALVPPAATAGPAGGYVRAHVTAEGVDPAMAVDVFLRIEPTGLHVVGIDRGWP